MTGVPIVSACDGASAVSVVHVLGERDCSENEQTQPRCSLTDALRWMCFDTQRFQSTLNVERRMDHQAPRTHGSIIEWAAPYDLLAWLLTHGREGQLRERFISLAGLREGDTVLDVGCGTGTLAIAARRQVGAAGSVRG